MSTESRDRGQDDIVSSFSTSAEQGGATGHPFSFSPEQSAAGQRPLPDEFSFGWEQPHWTVSFGAPASFEGQLRYAASGCAFTAGGDRISVLVTARNYGRFLSDCLTSIQSQTRPPFEVIYSDDGSNDNSVAIARSFPGVKILPRTHEGVAASRNAAVAASSGDLLVHVDGDDMLTPDFLEAHWRALAESPDAAFAYGPARAFGIRELDWTVPPWSRCRLWIRNFVNTSAMYRRWAFEATGGWRIGAGTCFDWDLALRASRFGPGIPSQALLLYRQHPGSWSRSYWGNRPQRRNIIAVHSKIRSQAATVTIGCVYSGRVPGLLPRWLAALADSIRGSDLPRPGLFVVDGSPSQSLAGTLAGEAAKYPEFAEVRYVRAASPIRLPIARENRDERAQFMAAACNQILDGISSDIVWFVEDDILVPENAYATLMNSLTTGQMPRPAVAGLYRSRHDPGCFVAHQWGRRIQTLREAPAHPCAVDLTGTGCLMIFRPFARHRFPSHVQNIPAHDWAWCWQLREQGARVIIHPDVPCRHHLDQERFV